MMRSQEISLNREFTYWWCLTVPMQKDSEKNKLLQCFGHASHKTLETAGSIDSANINVSKKIETSSSVTWTYLTQSNSIW